MSTSARRQTSTAPAERYARSYVENKPGMAPVRPNWLMGRGWPKLGAALRNDLALKEPADRSHFACHIGEELAGLPRHAVASLQPLRPKPRWFLYEHRDGVRHERALVSEWTARLSLNASDASALLRAHRASLARSAHLVQAAARSAHPPEPIELAFLPLDQLLSELRMRPGGFCAAGLLPAALIDSIGDLCLQLGTRGAPPGCTADHGWRWFHRLRGASSATLSDTYEPGNVALDPALQRGLDTSNLLVAALVLGCAWLGFRQLRRAMQGGGHT